MSILTKEDELGSFAPGTWEFWRNLAVYFCIWSVVGHWLEYAYCSFMNLFGIVDSESLVWDDLMFPFLVYGIGATICVVALVPIKEYLVKRQKTFWKAGFQFFFITVFLCMLMELAMGLMLNQPNAAGTYPLWDNSDLPFNILDQAWLINDLALGVLAFTYVWFIYPLAEKALYKVNQALLNVLSVIIVAAFILLCITKFA